MKFKTSLGNLAWFRCALSSTATTRYLSFSARRSGSTNAEEGHGESWPVGPGSPPGTIPTPFERAPGLERLEYLSEAEGVPLFLSSEPLKIESKGTLENPVMVETIEGERIVGCTGFPKHSHSVVWMNLKGYDHPGRCPDCGQVFKLKFAEMPGYRGNAAENAHSPATKGHAHQKGTGATTAKASH